MNQPTHATKTAIIIGGSAGVGRSVVNHLRKRNYRIGVIARGQERLDAMQQEFGEDVLIARSADASDNDALTRAVREITDILGEPSIWVNSAMLTSFSSFEAMDVAEFDAIIAGTFTSYVNGTRLALKSPNITHIVNVGSGLSYRPVPFQSAYCAAKHAINGFTNAVRTEMMRDDRDVTLSLVQLPAINTPQFDWARNRLPQEPQPAPPIYQPDVAARAVLRAIDTNAREIFVGASVLQLVLGNMVFPALLDKKMSKDGGDMQTTDTPQHGTRDGNVFTPQPYDSTPYGSFTQRAKDSGIIINADKLRLWLFVGVPLLLLLFALIT